MNTQTDLSCVLAKINEIAITSSFDSDFANMLLSIKPSSVHRYFSPINTIQRNNVTYTHTRRTETACSA